MDQETKEWHKKFAVETFNQTWDLMDKQDKSQAEIDRMIHAAHASRYHWEYVGEAVNLARGEWQISRVYATSDTPCLAGKTIAVLPAGRGSAIMDLCWTLLVSASGRTALGEC